MGPVAERCRLGRLRGRRLRKFPLTLRLPAIVEMRTRTHERESNPYFPDVLLHFQALISFQLGRYEEAVDLLMHRLARNAVTDVSRALLAASYGHLGRFAEARAAWQEVLRVNPDYSLDYRRKVLPYKNPAEFEHVVDGLRKAGVVQ